MAYINTNRRAFPYKLHRSLLTMMFKVPLLYALIGITLMAITDAHNGQNAAALDSAATEAVESPITAIDRARRLESGRVY